MQPRKASVVCEGQEPAISLCGMRAVRHLTHLRCWVVPGRDSSSSAGSVRRVPSLHSAVRLRLVITWPLFLHTSAGVNPARSVPGVQDTAVPAVGAACTHQYQEFEGHPVSTPSAGGVVPGFASNGVPSFQQVSRPGSGPGGRLLTHTVGLFRYSREPKVSLPRRSRARRPHTCQTASRATLHFVPRPMALPDSQPPHQATPQTHAAVRLDSTIG